MVDKDIVTEQMKKRVKKIISILKKSYPDAKCSLNYSNDFELLIATILSAQCTDERVNKITPKLFKKFKTPADFASSSLTQIQKYIKSAGFFRKKSEYIKNTSIKILKEHNGKVPRSMQQLISLPGVKRKTANIVLGNAFGIIEGIPVDTHMMRLSRILGLTNSKSQDKIEKDLMKIVPKKYWLEISNLFIAHGRAVCIARRPKCSICPIEKLCPKIGVKKMGPL